MSLLTLATPVISLDEPCFLLIEEHLQSPGAKGLHRYNIVTVVRNDELVEWHHDMGSAKKFRDVDQFRIPGGVQDPRTKRLYIEHTVGELREIADILRSRPSIAKQLPPTAAFVELQKYLARKEKYATQSN
mgnify:CR=1 FL=1